MLTSLMAAAATTGGKILVSAAALIGVAGGAQAAGVVDLIPDTSDDSVVQVAIQSDGAAREAAAQVPAPAAQSTGAPDEVLSEFRVPVEQAGSVVLVVADGAVEVSSVAFASGWAAAEDDSGDNSVEVVFTNAAGEQIILEAELVGEVVKVEVLDANGVETTEFFDQAGVPAAPPISAVRAPARFLAARFGR